MYKMFQQQELTLCGLVKKTNIQRYRATNVKILRGGM